MEKVSVKFKKLHENAVLPTYAKEGDMGMDLTAVSVEYDSKIDTYVYHTGLACEIPAGYGMLIFPRSSNRKTDCYMTNHVGVIDSGYRGEILVCFKNRTATEVADKCYLSNNLPYNEGDRIAQMVVIPYPFVECEFVDELSETERGEGGHGSTGK